MTNAVDIRFLSARYGDRVVLNDVSMTVPSGVLLAIVGPNGAGKSTLVKAMLGLVPSSGTVSVHGRPHSDNRKAVAYVPQRGSVDWDFPTTVFDVVLMGTYGELGWFRRPGEAQKNRALDALNRLGLSDLAGRQIGQLSGGQQQRTFLARALAQDASVLVMDEPFQGVDAVTERTIVGVLRELRAAGRTVICVHHDLGTVAEYFDWAAVMNVRMMSCGPVAETFTPETVRAAYGDRAAGLLPASDLMPLLGAHLSVSGGYFKACEAAVALNCETVQIFTKAPSQWAGKPITDEEAETFRKAVKTAKLKFPTAHDSYLINLAAPEPAAWEKSKDAFAEEIDRADKLGLKYLVTHPGAHMGLGEVAGVTRVIDALNDVLRRRPDSPLVILLETTAGMGTTLGHRFEHLRDMIGGVKQSKRLGVCLDTCHIFAAGYPIGTDEEYADTFTAFDRTIGLKNLKLFHLNDSIKGLGCRVDRHAGIGLGSIGEAPFRRLVTDPRFAKLPMVLETPKEDAAGEPMDPVNLAKLRSFR